MDSESEEAGFLRDQVKRLNAILSVYQDKYPPLSDQEKSQLDIRSSSLPPLVTDQSILAPIIIEYDAENLSLNKQINVYKSELDGLRSKVQRLVQENEKLHSDLRATVQGQLEAAGWTDGSEHGPGSDSLITKLKEEVESLKEEKEAALALWRTSSQKFEDVNTKLREIRSVERAEVSSYQALEEKSEQLLRKNNELVNAKQKLKRINEHLQEISATQTQELTDTREQLKLVRTDKRTIEIRLTEAQHSKSILEGQLHTKTKEAEDYRKESESLKSKLEDVSASLSKFQEAMELLTQETETLKGARRDLEDKVKNLHWKCAEADRREFEAVSQVRESIQMVENALLEKDEALIREKQKIQEIERLQQTLDNLVNEAGKRTRQEVDAVRKQCNKNIGRLMDEIQALENENGQRQAEIERLLREKRAVEDELEAVYREGSGQFSDQRTLQMQDRLITAERQKDEALMRTESLEKEMKRRETSNNDALAQLTDKLQLMKKRLEKSTKEAESLSEEKLRLTEELDLLKKKQSEIKKQRDSAERKFNKELSALHQEITLLKVEYGAKVESVEECSRQSSRELRQMVTTHQKIGAKFKEEAKSLTAKYEAKLTETRSELARLRKRNEDLSLQLAQTRESLLQAEQRLSQQTSINRKLSHSAAEQEQRANDLFMKLAEQGATEKRLLQEKKFLERELQRSREDKNVSRRSTASSLRNSLNESNRLEPRHLPGRMNGVQQNLSGLRSSSIDSDHSSADI
ncbi:Sodium channel and clathrin linker 1 [Holothuria leucospilota]|uniref:Sodium channel and clathrin linker 1 n=1 Tax=Holothuria leucospilota TaxID=206669 RepID=A0A9Q1BL32_HOLLE|nr:Sodium channel and clathrin linker 1 [Holothuria leucospilota]